MVQERQRAEPDEEEERGQLNAGLDCRGLGRTGRTRRGEEPSDRLIALQSCESTARFSYSKKTKQFDCRQEPEQRQRLSCCASRTDGWCAGRRARRPSTRSRSPAGRARSPRRSCPSRVGHDSVSDGDRLDTTAAFGGDAPEVGGREGVEQLAADHDAAQEVAAHVHGVFLSGRSDRTWQGMYEQVAA